MTKGCLLISFTAMLYSSLSFAAQTESQPVNPNEIRIVPVEPTPEPDNVRVRIVFPEENEVKTKNPVHLQIKVEGYPLETESYFLPRTEELVNDPNGQSIHVVIDDNPYFSLYEAIIDAEDNVQVYYNQTLDYDIPYPLNPGIHVIRAFPARTYGESLKGSGCFVSSIFYFRVKKNDQKIDLSMPYLTYNEPQGSFKYNPSQPILLDFLISNCQLSKDGYKVRLSIDGNNQRILTQWVPYYIYGLSKGTHIFRLELLDHQNKLVVGPYNDVQRSIKIE